MQNGNDVNDIVANPEKHGYVWGNGKVEKNGTVLSMTAPHIIHKNRELIEKTFGDNYFLDIANGGQSGKVRDQSVTREALWANRKLTDTELKTLVIQRALGMKSARATRTVEIHYGADGKQYNSAAEAIEASKKFYQNQK